MPKKQGAQKLADEQRAEDQRAADQDAAIEQAFVDGTLPEEDRRTDVSDVVPPTAGIPPFPPTVAPPTPGAAEEARVLADKQAAELAAEQANELARIGAGGAPVGVSVPTFHEHSVVIDYDRHHRIRVLIEAAEESANYAGRSALDELRQLFRIPRQ